MSKRSETIAAEECIALGAGQPQLDAYPNREVNLGALAVARALPDQGSAPRGAMVLPRPLWPTDI